MIGYLRAISSKQLFFDKLGFFSLLHNNEIIIGTHLHIKNLCIEFKNKVNEKNDKILENDVFKM